MQQQQNVEATPRETVTLITELPEPSLDVTWLKDNVPLPMIDANYETINKDCSYALVIPDVTVEDADDYKVQGGGFESVIPLIVNGEFMHQIALAA